jgi:hypothetical protein
MFILVVEKHTPKYCCLPCNKQQPWELSERINSAETGPFLSFWFFRYSELRSLLLLVLVPLSPLKLISNPSGAVIVSFFAKILLTRTRALLQTPHILPYTSRRASLPRTSEPCRSLPLIHLFQSHFSFLGEQLTVSTPLCVLNRLWLALTVRCSAVLSYINTLVACSLVCVKLDARCNLSVLRENISRTVQLRSSARHGLSVAHGMHGASVLHMRMPCSTVLLHTVIWHASSQQTPLPFLLQHCL